MFASLVVLASLLGTPPEGAERPSYLFTMSGPAALERAESYRAQPGDIVLFDDHNHIMAKIYRCCGTAGPMHAGVVFRKPDGQMAILEAGTNAVMKVFVFGLEPRLHDFHGTILVRRLREPLTEEHARKLADFAARQEGKPYALGRLILHGATQRMRSAVGPDFLGRTVLDRNRWICSELVVASATSAGIWNADAYPANVMYPRDLCYDERFDLSPHYESPSLWYPRPELEYMGKGVRVIPPKER